MHGVELEGRGGRVRESLFHTLDRSLGEILPHFFFIFVRLFVFSSPARVCVWQAVLTSDRVSVNGGRRTLLFFFLMAVTGSLVKRRGACRNNPAVNMPGTPGTSRCLQGFVFFFSLARSLADGRSLFDDSFSRPPPPPPDEPRSGSGARGSRGGLRRGGGCCSLADVTRSPQTSAKLIHDSVSVCRRGTRTSCPRCLFAAPQIYI